MSRILVIGGYGGFGARLSRRLAAAGHRVLVGGRTPRKAKHFCATLPGAEPVLVDRDGDVRAVLAGLRPDLVIDAAGPFQGSRFEVPFACVAADIPYLDLADARDFVLGVAALDRIAGPVRVPVISGVSSISALSGAVIRALAGDLTQVEAVDMSISASNRSSAGASVAAAILSYVGKPVRLWRGRRWVTTHGWQDMRREDYRLPDGAALLGRKVAVADVADHAIVPDALPGRPAVTFRAGTELGFQMRALWLLSWPVRWGWPRSLAGAGRWLLPLYRLTLGLGGARSAMTIVVRGKAGECRVERCWTLIAENGDGREIPVLAAALLAEDILAGKVAPGARHAWHELPLARFEPALAGLAVRHGRAERASPAPLYARLLGAGFDVLPPVLRALHDVGADAAARGEALVERGHNPVARLLAAAMRFPPAGRWPLHVAFAERDGAETWTRDFGGHRFSSTLSQEGGLISERFGPIRFLFRLDADRQGLRMILARWAIFGVPLPLALAPRLTAREWQEDDRFRFDVEARMPGIGRVIRYAGWLRPIVPARSHLEVAQPRLENILA